MRARGQSAARPPLVPNRQQCLSGSPVARDDQPVLASPAPRWGQPTLIPCVNTITITSGHGIPRLLEITYRLASTAFVSHPASQPSLITEVSASQSRDGLPPTSRIWHGQRSTGLCGVNPVLVNMASPCVSPSAFPHRNMDRHACLRTAALEHTSSVQQASQKNAMKQFSREHTTPAVGCAATSEERSPGNVSSSPRRGGGGRHTAACATHELASPTRSRVPPIPPAASGWSVFGNRRFLPRMIRTSRVPTD